MPALHQASFGNGLLSAAGARFRAGAAFFAGALTAILALTGAA
jgi:hypothetical protein